MANRKKDSLRREIAGCYSTLNTQERMLYVYEQAEKAMKKLPLQFPDAEGFILHALWNIKPRLDLSKPISEEDKVLYQLIEALEEKFDCEKNLFAGLTEDDWKLIGAAIAITKLKVKGTIAYYEEKIKQLEQELAALN